MLEHDSSSATGADASTGGAASNTAAGSATNGAGHHHHLHQQHQPAASSSSCSGPSSGINNVASSSSVSNNAEGSTSSSSGGGGASTSTCAQQKQAAGHAEKCSGGAPDPDADPGDAHPQSPAAGDESLAPPSEAASSSAVPYPCGAVDFSSSGGGKPVPMKLFATWEVDRTPPNCIPRLCTLNLRRLVLHKSLGSDLTSVIIAVKMQSSKRTLRSNEMELPSSGLLDTDLDLTFSLQYPHFLKRDGNQLHVMLQRRKRYKNRTILGFKTLAVGTINMSQVLQKQLDLELELFGDIKEKSATGPGSGGGGSGSAGLMSGPGSGGAPVGKVYMLSLSSQPVDHEDTAERVKGVPSESADRDLLYSDDDEDFSSAEEGSDSEPILDDLQRHRRFHPKNRATREKAAAAQARQRNLKQKFVSLLKKFKVTDPDLDNEQASLDQKLSEGSMDPAEIEDLFEQLEDYSDSGPDVDTISIGSTPKPSLKPFFQSSKNLLAQQKQQQQIMYQSQQGSVGTASTSIAGGGTATGSGGEAKMATATTAASMSAVEPALQFSSQQGSDPGGGGGSDRLSEDSSKEGVSDSHPETLTDPEFSDPQLLTSSPPQSGDELYHHRQQQQLAHQAAHQGHRESKERSIQSERSRRLFSKDKRSESTGGSNNLPSQGGPILLKQTKLSAQASAPPLTSQMASSLSSSMTSSSMMASTSVSMGSAMSFSNRAVERTSALGTSDTVSPRKVLLEQLSRVLPSDSESLPDQVILVNTFDRQGAHVAAKLAESIATISVICTAGPADVRAVLTCIVAKLQKFCNTQVQTPPSVKVALIGSDTFINSVLRPYVELFSSKPPDWQGYVKFFIIPLGTNTVSKYVGSMDPVYSKLFLHESWRELLEKAEPDRADVKELVSRISQYLRSSSTELESENLMQLPVAEAMVTYKEKGSDEESSNQVFVPFVSDVRVFGGGAASEAAQEGPSEDQTTPSESSMAFSTLSGGVDKSANPGSLLVVGSPPAVESLTASPARLTLTPPSSPHVGKDSMTKSDFYFEPVDLQLDYWVSDSSSFFNASFSSSSSRHHRGDSSGGLRGLDSKRGGFFGGEAKSSIKSSIRYMMIHRAISSSSAASSLSNSQEGGLNNTFTMQYWTKEKKAKAVMRLGKKKEKSAETEVKSQTVEGISRLICLSKAQTPLTVHIDGHEWPGVKFFQLSSQWQTHIKAFPIATCVASAQSAELSKV